MNAIKSAVLPVLAVTLTIMAITYSACNETKANSTKDDQSAQLRAQIDQFEMNLTELKKVNDENVKSYSNEMGCNGESTMLDKIKQNTDLLTHYTQRLDYHKLQLVQADTLNSERNKQQLAELKKDMDDLEKDAKTIKEGFTTESPTHVTK
ncbi:MAG TPA: hypothetical protein VL651_08765 [Bacteroidia bacterium]|nr:hypothetical protein [Bacteroidia bacterium]